MSLSTQVPESQRVVAPQLVLHYLRLAQHRLHDRHISFQLAALAYLRLSCVAICLQQRQRSLSTLEAKTLYLALLDRLTKAHPRWWEQCCVSEYGYLISGDHQIRALLQPLNTAVERILEESQMPDSATDPADPAHPFT